MAKILIADDEVAVTTQMEERLANMGYDVTESASSGDESVDLARRFHPDAILMDIVMPGRMDGISAARKIREEMDIPVIFLTAYADDNTVRRAIKTNPYGYIVKPFHEKGVKAAIEVALYKKKWEQSLAAANKKLKKGEQMLRLIATNMNDLVFMTDLNGNIQYATPSLKDILGYETEERIGRPSFELVHPEDIENLKTIFANAIATSTPAKARYRLKHADGHYVWVEAAGNFIFDDDGQAVGAILNIRDITDRKQSEKALRDSEKKYRTLAETTNDVTIVLDLDGKFTYISPVVEKSTGHSWNDFIGRPFTEMIAPEYVKSTTERFKKGLAGKEFPLIEIEVRHKDGGTVPVELNVTSLTDATGKTTGRIGVARDITSRRHAEAALKKSEERYQPSLKA